MSACKYCGVQIAWAKNKSGGWLPPFDVLGGPIDLGIDLGENVLLAPSGSGYIHIYDPQKMILGRPHVCQVRTVLEEEPQQRPPLVERTLQQGRNEKNERTREKYWKSPQRLEVLAVTCPICSADVGEPCASTVIRVARMFITGPHKERRDAVGVVQAEVVDSEPFDAQDAPVADPEPATNSRADVQMPVGVRTGESGEDEDWWQDLTV